MHIIINNSSMVPIYEQIIDQIKTAIIRGELQPDTVLPSVRSLSKELKISALTVKKAYDNLEEEGFTVTVHGKGTYVAATNKNLMREEQLKEVEHDLEQAIMKGRRCGLNDEEIRNLFEMIMEDYDMLKIIHLQKHYRGFSLDCSMEVQPGMITGLIGRNGSGKSTTFKALLGLIHPDGGEIEVFGKKAEELKSEDKQKLGVVFADSGFSMYLTAAGVEDIMKSIYPDFDREKFLQQCRRFNLPTDKKIKEFSTGMKAKFKVLAALSHKAELLILDEPTVGLDVIARDEVLNMLREYMEENESSSILISSHISSDLESLCDDFYMIHAGKIILHEDTDVLLSDYAVLKVSEEEYEKLDQQYLIKIRKEAYGYRCLTNQKQFYMENYPDVVIENGKIDDLVVMMEEQV